MPEVIFVLRGQKVALDEVKDGLERAALQAIQDSIVDRVGGLRCPEHGAEPRVTATGPRPDALEFDLAGCCDALLKMTARCFE